MSDYFQRFSGFLQTYYGFITLKGIFLFLVLPFSSALKAETPYILFIFILMELLVKKGEVNAFPLGMKKCTSYRGLSQKFTEVKKKGQFFWPPNNCTFHQNDCRHKSALGLLSDNPLDIYLSLFGFNNVIYVHTLQYLVYIDR